jgi:hypothetical protein
MREGSIMSGENGRVGFRYHLPQDEQAQFSGLFQKKLKLGVYYP